MRTAAVAVRVRLEHKAGHVPSVAEQHGAPRKGSKRQRLVLENLTAHAVQAAHCCLLGTLAFPCVQCNSSMQVKPSSSLRMGSARGGLHCKKDCRTESQAAQPSREKIWAPLGRVTLAACFCCHNSETRGEALIQYPGCQHPTQPVAGSAELGSYCSLVFCSFKVFRYGPQGWGCWQPPWHRCAPSAAPQHNDPSGLGSKHAEQRLVGCNRERDAS